MDLSEPTKAVWPSQPLWQQVSEVHYLLCRQVLSLLFQADLLLLSVNILSFYYCEIW